MRKGREISNKPRSWIDIDLDAFANNFRKIKKHLLPNQSILQVVKADAYGHGAYQISKVALENGAVLLGVANIDEAIALRIQGIEAPILILSPSYDRDIDKVIEYNVIPSLSNDILFEKLNKAAEKRNVTVHVHLEFNTGMNRSGFKDIVLSNSFDKLLKYKNIRVEGLFSHFAASEDDPKFSIEQSDLFQEYIDKLSSKKYESIKKDIKWLHLCNSTGIFNHNEAKYNLVRVGIMSYGYYLDETLQKKINLTPVMSFKSQVALTCFAKENETLGYNRTYKAEERIDFALVPVGYADGYDYLLSNKSHVGINGKLYPVRGKISMDVLTIETFQDLIKDGDEVTLLGTNHPRLQADYLTSLYNGSVYELLCQLGRRAKRYYYYKDRLIDDEPSQRRSFIPIDYQPEKLNTMIQMAISERMNNTEISNVVYNDILRYFFLDSDKDITYRSDFRYNISFHETGDPEYYTVNTQLMFDKVLQNDEFTVVCANDETKLNYFFKDKYCEYRWLLDNVVDLSDKTFQIQNVSVDGKRLNYITKTVNSCLVYKFQNELLKELMNKEVSFLIETATKYPKRKNIFKVYINEITKGVSVKFKYSSDMFDVDTTAVFSGQERYPEIKSNEIDNGYREIAVETGKDKWVFPSSAVIFSFVGT